MFCLKDSMRHRCHLFLLGCLITTFWLTDGHWFVNDILAVCNIIAFIKFDSLVTLPSNHPRTLPQMRLFVSHCLHFPKTLPFLSAQLPCLLQHIHVFNDQISVILHWGPCCGCSSTWIRGTFFPLQSFQSWLLFMITKSILSQSDNYALVFFSQLRA